MASIPIAQLFFDKGFVNFCLVSGGIEDFAAACPEFLEGDEVPTTKLGHISITLLPTPILFWHIRAIWGLNRPNMPKYAWGW